MKLDEKVGEEEMSERMDSSFSKLKEIIDKQVGEPNAKLTQVLIWQEET